MIRENFVCVTMETGVARHRQDATGDFLRTALGPDFFPTSSGYKHAVSAGGVDLGQVGEAGKVLEKFRALPDGERAPGAIRVGPHGPIDREVTPDLPPVGGLVVEVHGRLLAREGEGGLRHVTADDFPLMADHDERRRAGDRWLFEASTDHWWVRAEEWREWIPAAGTEPKVGWMVEVQAPVAQRLARFHLSPQRIYAEGGEWSGSEVREAALSLTIEAVSAGALTYSLEGRIALGSEYVGAKATTPNGPLGRGYEAQVRGRMTYDRSAERITGLEAVVLGDSWGRVGDANGRSVSIERPGRHPLAFAIGLVKDPKPVDCLVPMGRASKLRGLRYFGEAGR